jgi:hypothetical protein
VDQGETLSYKPCHRKWLYFVKGAHVPEHPITVMGMFVADLAFRTTQLPAWGQTVLGAEYRLGPGGKGSNQAVAAARLGGAVARTPSSPSRSR